MSNLLAVLIGALIGLGGVVAGTWLQGRKEHQRWLRDQKLHAATDFIGATGDLAQQRRQLASGGAGDMNERRCGRVCKTEGRLSTCSARRARSKPLRP
jgi:hypothetical protein